MTPKDTPAINNNTESQKASGKTSTKTTLKKSNITNISIEMHPQYYYNTRKMTNIKSRKKC